MNMRTWSKSRLLFLALGVILVGFGIWSITASMLAG
jgi:hypothetical protein